MAPLLMGALLAITTVLFITLPISPMVDNTLGENIFGLFVNQKEKNEK